MAVLAHPDDESLGVGGTLAKYASEGVDVFLLTATRGDGGRYRGHRPGDHQHPGPLALAHHPRGRAARRRIGAGCARRFAARLPRPASRSRDPARGCRGHRQAPAAGSSRRRRDVRARRRLRTSGSHRDLSVHHGGLVAGGRPRVSVRRRRGAAAASGVEALLPGVAGIDVGRLSGSVQADWSPPSTASNGRRRRGPNGRSPP